MQPPVKPTPGTFGLTEADLSALPKRWFDAGHGTSNLFGRFLIGGAIAIEFVIFSINHSFGKTLLLGLYACPAGAVIGGLAFALLGQAEKKIRSNSNPTFKKAYAYWAAGARYEQEKREYEAWLAKRRQEYWLALSGTAFEMELGRLFIQHGYAVNTTPRTGDGGVDLIMTKGGKRTIVQCKAHKKKIPISVARELCASMIDFRANDAIIACFYGVTQPVADYIKHKPIKVLDVHAIVRMQRELDN